MNPEMKNGCFLATHVIEKIQQLYKNSDLEVLNYLHKCFPRDLELERKYAQLDYDNSKIEIFWEVMRYYGLVQYLV